MASVLLLVDVQQHTLMPPTSVPDAESVAKAISAELNRARVNGDIVVHTRNNGSADDPDAPGSPGWELVHDVLDGEHIVDKGKPDAFAGTALSKLIPTPAGVVVVGMRSEYSIRRTCLTALRMGHLVTLIRGAHATYDGDAPGAAISRRIEAELLAAGVAVVSRQRRAS